MPLDKLIIHRQYAERLKKRTLTLRFKPGINLLIGPNGSGKSTIVECIRKEVLPKKKEKDDPWSKKEPERHATWTFTGKPLAVLVFDFEKDNPRLSGPGWIDDLSSIRRMQMHWTYKAKSHGEFTRDVLQELDLKLMAAKGKMFVLMDEPEQALDLGGMRLLHHYLAKRRHAIAQAIIATHHPFLIADPTFNVIEMKKSYRGEILRAIKSVAEQLG